MWEARQSTGKGINPSKMEKERRDKSFQARSRTGKVCLVDMG